MYTEVFEIETENRVRRLMVSTADLNVKDFSVGSIGIGSYAAKLKIWRRSSIDEVINIQIGNFVSIAADVNFVVNLNHDYENITTSPVGIFAFIERENYTRNQKGSIIVGNDVWIGNGVTVLPDVKIGNGAVIGNGTVVAKDIPPYAVVVGNPARVIKYRFEKEQIEKLQELKWWYWELKDIEAYKIEFVGGIDNFLSKFYKLENEQLEKVELNKKSKGILFVPDFEEKQYPVWKRVLKQYINKFKAQDDVTLVIRIENDDKFEENVSSISNFIYDDPSNPDILILNDNVKNIKSIFKDMEYFITTRVINTIRYIDYCEELNVKVISGVNVDIFKNVI